MRTSLEVDKLFTVDGRVVVVTGGLGQLGRQYALALRERGARVAILDIGVTDVRIDAAYGSKANHENLLFLEADVTSSAALRSAAAEIVRVWDVPSGLINNAALDAPPDADARENGPFEEYPDSSFERILSVNVKGTFLSMQAIGAHMAASGRGSIINVSSIYGMVSPNQSIYEYRRQAGEEFFKPVAYAASKSAIFNLTRYAATYWAGKGVRVNTLTLAGVYNKQPPQFLDSYNAHIPIGRMANEDEFNGAVIFLLSDASSYMTGSNLIVDGGWTAW